MRRGSSAAGLAAALCAGAAAAPAVDDTALLKAALIVRTFDHYARACQLRGGFQGADAAAVTAWQAEHGVGRIRTRLAELEADPARRQQLERGVADVVRQIDAKGVEPCRAALTAGRTRDAPFATVAPACVVVVAPDRVPSPAAARCSRRHSRRSAAAAPVSTG